ncbi:hypothetical protein [Paramicrobacterium agarici]|uniref:VapC45 PIN like domain-containing protein n=1 Tax=Paramicrobacterium agarici TaxID=630514 RepID=A0A2A9DXQ2_9MICO|nr:hypothetical protein ATJ78_1646 [Microbacterium agarici]
MAPEFFLDRSLGRKKLATALRNAGWRVATLSEVYGVQHGQLVADTTWISEQADAGRVLLTSDARILSDPGERQAIVSASALMFTFPSARMRSEDHFARLSTHRARLADIAIRDDVPAAYVLYERTISRVLP